MHHAQHAGFQPWQVALTLALLLTGMTYVRGWIRIRHYERDSIEGWRGAAFLLGLSLTWLAMASPAASLDHELLTAHMVQHLLLMTLVPPLIWLGAPVKVLSKAPGRDLAEVSGRFRRSTFVERLINTVAHPAVGWLAAATTLIAWHIPFLFALGMRSELWHGLEQASFLLSGLLFWWPVIRPHASSEWSMLLYLFLATLPCDILSGLLVFCDRVVYPMYSSSPQMPGFSALTVSALEDQQCAGALMWTCVTIVYLIAGTIFAARLLSPERARKSRVSASDATRKTESQKSPWTAETA
jgi:putative membrane protein